MLLQSRCLFGLFLLFLIWELALVCHLHDLMILRVLHHDRHTGLKVLFTDGEVSQGILAKLICLQLVLLEVAGDEGFVSLPVLCLVEFAALAEI